MLSRDKRASCGGLSLEAQGRKLRELARIRELGALELFEGAGFSGKDLNRLQTILKRIDSGGIENLIAWKIDRLSRSVGDLDQIVRLLAEAGVVLHSVMEPLDLSSASGRMQFGINGVIAQWYGENLSENVQLGMQ